MKNILQKIDWKKVEGLIPAIIQNAKTGQILMLGYMNKEALTKTLSTKRVWFYSRTKKRLWMKGEVSRNFLNLVDILLDCDNDTLLVKVMPSGPSCHTGKLTCFKDDNFIDLLLINELFELIKSRKLLMPKDSYTASLFRAGLDKICGKIYEESAEVVKAAQKETKKRLTEEAVDLIYHLFVLLVQKGLKLKDLLKEIERRRK